MGSAFVALLDSVTLHIGLTRLYSGPRLNDHCSVFQAEVWAIRASLLWIQKSSFRNIRVCSDSQAALKAIYNMFHSNKLVQDTSALLLTLRDRHLSLVWVKAHIGIPGNKRADKEAKYSTTLPNYKRLGRPLSMFKLLLKQHLLNQWQYRWNSGTNGRFTYMLLPTVSFKRLWSDRTLTRIVTNHAHFPAYLDRFNLECVPPSSLLCGLSALVDGLHFIIFCDGLKDLRDSLCPHLNSIDHFKKLLKSSKGRFIIIQLGLKLSTLYY